jgi:ATP-dependent protease HslVU (ClpYQ) ATPase subunit
MKYVLFFDTPQARDGPLPSLEMRKKEIIERQEVMKDEKKYGKTVFPAHQYATGKGLAIVEFDNPKQIANRMAFNTPDGNKSGVVYQIMPLIEGTMFQESLNEIRK